MARVLPLPPLLPVVLVLALAGAGCPRGGGAADGGTDAGEPECTSRADCEQGLACSPEGRCVPCDSSGQCLLKEYCNPQSQACELKTGWGSACARNEACQAGEWCRQGVCLARDLVRLCASGQSTECGRGERCNTVNLVCEEDLGCTAAADCGEGETCNPGSRKCVPRCTEATQAQVCAAGERCVSERCAQCAGNADCSAGQTCDAAGRCVAAARCYSDRDCKVPLICYQPTGDCLEKPPACSSDESCPAEDRCDLGSGRCVPRGCQTDRYEPSNTREQAAPVTPGTYEALTLCERDVDFWALTLSTGDRLGVSLAADPYSESTFATLVQDGSGRTVAAGRLEASYVAPARGTYYVAVSTSDITQPYDVTFLLSRGTPCVDDGAEPNDTPAQATPVNASRMLDGAICPQDQDHYSVAVDAGRALTVRLADYDYTAGPLGLCVFSGATQLGCSSDAQLASPSVSVAAAGGARTLTVRVRGDRDTTANVYTLQVEVGSPGTELEFAL